jgi:hypothetical protein
MRSGQQTVNKRWNMRATVYVVGEGKKQNEGKNEKEAENREKVK